MNTIQLLQAYIKAGGDVDKVTSFVGVREKAIGGWIRGSWSPVGISLLNLRNFLRMEGYVPDEVTHLDPVCDQIGLAISHGLIAYDDLLKRFNLAGTSHGHSFLSRQLLRGMRVCHPERLEKARALVSEFEIPLKEICARHKSSTLQVANLGNVGSTNRTQITMSSNNTGKTVQMDGIGKSFVVKSLRALVVATAPMAGLVASDHFSPDERKEIRESFAGKELHHLVDALQQLLSETTRRQIRERNSQ